MGSIYNKNIIYITYKLFWNNNIKSRNIIVLQFMSVTNLITYLYYQKFKSGIKICLKSFAKIFKAKHTVRKWVAPFIDILFKLHTSYSGITRINIALKFECVICHITYLYYQKDKSGIKICFKIKSKQHRKKI